jgi:hypothetical protein
MIPSAQVPAAGCRAGEMLHVIFLFFKQQKTPGTINLANKDGMPCKEIKEAAHATSKYTAIVVLRTIYMDSGRKEFAPGDLRVAGVFAHACKALAKLAATLVTSPCVCSNSRVESFINS